MKYAIPGLLVGALLNLFVFSPRGAVQISPEWFGEIAAIDSIETSPSAPKAPSFFVRTGDGGALVAASGKLVSHASVTDSLAAWSPGGRFYAAYQKVGDHVEFCGIAGERYWKIKSMEYPYLSRGAKLILLLNGDQTMVRFVDNSGNEIGDRSVSGMTCTVIAFSQRGDFGAVGFFDGSYHVIAPTGKVIRSGRAPRGMMVKSITVSDDGSFAAIHMGDTTRDGLRIVDTASGDSGEAALKNVHTSKTSLHVNEKGRAVIQDIDAIRCFKKNGSLAYSINVPHRRPGMSSISHYSGIYASCYARVTGSGQLVLFDADGKVLLMREYPAETYLDGSIDGGLMLLRGSDNLYCYRVDLPGGR